jgi:hypothetical protein
MSELSQVELGPLFTPEERDIIEVERAKAILNDPNLDITDQRLLDAHRIAEAAARVGSKATIESRF